MSAVRSVQAQYGVPATWIRVSGDIGLDLPELLWKELVRYCEPLRYKSKALSADVVCQLEMEKHMHQAGTAVERQSCTTMLCTNQIPPLQTLKISGES